ncbi:hypothetical protein HanIR_Chr11g0548801 [Helianthus annuus]|nr:hypothetical protein HanIR_Chr11g0548801 [Helianthus annuus]
MQMNLMHLTRECLRVEKPSKKEEDRRWGSPSPMLTLFYRQFRDVLSRDGRSWVSSFYASANPLFFGEGSDRSVRLWVCTG